MLSLGELVSLKGEVDRRVKLGVEARKWLNYKLLAAAKDRTLLREIREKGKVLDGVWDREIARLQLLRYVLGDCDQIAYYSMGGEKHHMQGIGLGKVLMATCGDVVGDEKIYCVDCANGRKPATLPNVQLVLDEGFWKEVAREIG